MMESTIHSIILTITNLKDEILSREIQIHSDTV